MGHPEIMRFLKGRRWLVGLSALVAVAALVFAFVHVGFQPDPHPQAGHRASRLTGKQEKPLPAPSASSTGPPSDQLPETLIIEKIGVRAVIEQVTVDGNNNMAPPRKPTDVGWYSPGVAPGQIGDAVIDGHLDWHNMPQAVFFKLDRLRAGDRIEVINRAGTKLRFRVTGARRVAATAHPNGLFGTGGPPRLTLITCAGDWSPHTGQYKKRLLVEAAYVSRQ